MDFIVGLAAKYVVGLVANMLAPTITTGVKMLIGTII